MAFLSQSWCNMSWSPGSTVSAMSSSTKAIVSVILVFLVSSLFFSGWIDTSTIATSKTNFLTAIFPHSQKSITSPSFPNPYTPFTCRNLTNLTNSSCGPTPPTPTPTTLFPSPTCPSFFRYIHEDLRPWAHSGISNSTLLSAKPHANFRFLVINGRAYLDKYHGAFQTRDVFTLWGLLQLLRKYPGRVPDVDIMFNLGDMPVVRAEAGIVPPPLFRYCKDGSTVDIVFPDWSFWGWPEVNIKPWNTIIEEIKKGNRRTKWKHREPYAYWKGNPWVASTRQDLMKCNVSNTKDWNARLYSQDWAKETKEGFKSSDLASQCTHRYKIYIEGRAWSVSEKYILACDSPTLLVNTNFQDFLSRGLMPGTHYLPIRNNDKCRSIKSAVDWGNSHQKKAYEIGKASVKFIEEEVTMDSVYDYMLHLLTEYSKLLTYKPTIPENAMEICVESMACAREEGRTREFMMESMVTAPHDVHPCTMPPPFSPGEIQELRKNISDAVAQVESWK